MATILNPVPGDSAERHPEAHTPDLDEATLSALRLWVIMNRAQSAVNVHAAADVARHGLTLAEFGILEALYHRGPMLLGEVQKRVLVSSGGITFLVDRLTVKGLVERRACDSDRRARYAALTERGRELMVRIFPEHARELARVMAGVSLGEQQVATAILKTMGRAAAVMSEPGEDSSGDSGPLS